MSVPCVDPFARYAERVYRRRLHISRHRERCASHVQGSALLRDRTVEEKSLIALPKNLFEYLAANA